ncbi:cytochrome-c oxidase, cbb3-type subunit I [Bacteriovoracaceae bacterium]|nr:cytochrome-c oxidase, cbb3-type subunit I [Bacteriovoracaceae bacterium]
MSKTTSNMVEVSYDNKVVKAFIQATLLWGFVAMLLGVTIALQLANFNFNFDLPWLTFGRLRPLHTNAAIFAFVGNGMFAGVYYSLQRLLKARLFNDTLSWIHFWGWQLIIVAAAVTIPFGFSQGKEYAELEWPIDIAITLIWVVFAVNFFGTIKKRREKHIYVAIWFYIATVVTVALLHVVNSISLPVSFMKSYSFFAGAQDALIQWWYGHNAVAFFLTTPILGLMYYFVPKAANRPVYSYRLSIIHFWSLVFIYIWAGPHHLLYTALPEWVQTVGMAFSVALWAPSWGGMINGLLTLRGRWDKVKTDHTLKFLATAVTFYGMSTFEGPLLSIKSINAVAHFTDWIVGHVHAGTIGWNYMLTAGMLYYLVPKLWKAELYSPKLANLQFWLATFGLVLYIVSMWVAGITQGMMWMAVSPESGNLIYPHFIETVTQIVPMYWVRAIGGILVLTSFGIMIYNFWKTIKSSNRGSEMDNEVAQVTSNMDQGTGKPKKAHQALEGLPAIFTILVFLSVIVGTIIELAPTFLASSYIEKSEDVTPYTPLELLGRDVYIKEGCYTCHSQMIRPMVNEKLRYGHPSHISESIYDHPFQWGSRRIGPDLARVGGKYPHMWHYRHMVNPREMTPGSIMPNYPWLIKNRYNLKQLQTKMKVMVSLGVPYTEEEIASAVADATSQAEEITESLVEGGIPAKIQDKEVVALIAYLQRLGTDMQFEDEDESDESINEGEGE